MLNQLSKMETTNHDTANRTLSITRTLSAPVDLVWEAWTNREYIASWWGPAGFINTFVPAGSLAEDPAKKKKQRVL